MDEDISIINSNTRQEKVRNFFVNNKNKIISTIIILIVILVGAYSFDSYKTNKKKEISDKFNSTTLAYSESTKERTIQNLVIVKVIPEDNIMLVKGSVPGHKGSTIIIKPTQKKYTPNEIYKEKITSQASSESKDESSSENKIEDQVEEKVTTDKKET